MPLVLFPLISLPSLYQFGHDTYQMKAEYLSYQMVSFTILVVIRLKISLKKSNKFYVFTFIFFNLDRSINTLQRLFKLSEVIPDIIMGEPCLRFVIYALVLISWYFESNVFKMYIMFPDFWHKVKSRT